MTIFGNYGIKLFSIYLSNVVQSISLVINDIQRRNRYIVNLYWPLIIPSHRLWHTLNNCTEWITFKALQCLITFSSPIGINIHSVWETVHSRFQMPPAAVSTNITMEFSLCIRHPLSSSPAKVFVWESMGWKVQIPKFCYPITVRMPNGWSSFEKNSALIPNACETVRKKIACYTWQEIQI